MVKAKLKVKIFELAGGYAVRIPKSLVDTGLLKNKIEYEVEIKLPDDNVGSRISARDIFQNRKPSVIY